MSSCRVFEIPQIPCAFEFESEWPNGNLVTKQSLNCHSANLEKLVEGTNGNLATKQFESGWLNDNSMTVLLPNCHSAVQTQTQTQTESEAYRMHPRVIFKYSVNSKVLPKRIKIYDRRMF